MQWLNNPAGIINLLGTAVPQTASFFLIYMAVLTFLTTPLGGLRVVGMILYYIKTKIAATERARARLWQDQFAQYGADVRPYPTTMKRFPAIQLGNHCADVMDSYIS